MVVPCHSIYALLASLDELAAQASNSVSHCSCTTERCTASVVEHHTRVLLQLLTALLMRFNLRPPAAMMHRSRVSDIR
jgi:hypothetical protein